MPARTPHRRRSRILPATLALLVLLLLLLPACTNGRDALTIYSGRGQNLVGPLLDQFSRDTGIPIDVRYQGSAELALLLDQEGDATPADVFYAQNPGAVGFLASKGLLAELPDAVLDRVDSRFRSEDGLWVGITGRQRVLVYNRELVDESELPDSVFDVVTEPYAGRVAVAPTNGSFQDFVTAMIETSGEDVTLEWLTELAEQGAPVYANNNAIVDAVARGEAPMGLVNHYYNHRFLDEDPNLPTRNHVFPDGDIGALLIPSSASVLAASDDPRAIDFIEYLLSEPAQRYFRDETFEYPVASGIEPAADLPPLSTLELPALDVDRLDDLRTTTDLIERSGLRN